YRLSRSRQQHSGVRHLAQPVQAVDLAGVPAIDWVYVILSPDARTAEAYQQVFCASLAPLYQALQPHPVQRVVFVSSTSVYGAQQGEWVDENSVINPATHPLTATAQVLWQAEQQWRERWQNRLIVVRPSGIYGAQRQRLLNWVKQAKPVKTGQWTNRIHEADLAGFLSHLLSLAKTSVNTINASSDEALYVLTDQCPVQQHKVLDYIANLLHLKPLERIESPVTGKRIRSLYLADSGYVLRYPSYIEGYAAIIAQQAEADFDQ
ncbi:MAG: NAD-dependent epimerase/dehydratase family protein, partial [Moraxellaceae bacterium]